MLGRQGDLCRGIVAALVESRALTDSSHTTNSGSTASVLASSLSNRRWKSRMVMGLVDFVTASLPGESDAAESGG